MTRYSISVQQQPSAGRTVSAFSGLPAAIWSPSIPQAGALLFPSTGLVVAYVGFPGLILYLVCAVLTLLAGRALLVRIRRWPGPAWADRLALLTLVGLFVVFAIVYPRVNTSSPGRGSDADDALNLATQALLSGRYPYHLRTYLDNPVSPMPGALVLAMPFVLLGSSAYQVFFWLPVFYLALRRRLGAWPALLANWLVLVLAPVVLQNVLTGSDHVSNALYVLLLSWWTAETASCKGWRSLVPPLLLGLGLSSRLNYLLLLPVLVAALVRLAGWRAALLRGGLTATAFVAITLPFALPDPSVFTPLWTANKLGYYSRGVLPIAELAVPILCAILAIMLAFRPGNRRVSGLFAQSAAIQAWPVLALIVVSSLARGGLSLDYAAYGIFFLYFALAAGWLSAAKRPV